ITPSRPGIAASANPVTAMKSAASATIIAGDGRRSRERPDTLYLRLGSDAISGERAGQERGRELPQCCRPTIALRHAPLQNYGSASLNVPGLRLNLDPRPSWRVHRSSAAGTRFAWITTTRCPFGGVPPWSGWLPASENATQRVERLTGASPP